MSYTCRALSFAGGWPLLLLGARPRGRVSSGRCRTTPAPFNIATATRRVDWLRDRAFAEPQTTMDSGKRPLS